MLKKIFWRLAMVLLFTATPAFAANSNSINGGDTAWMIVATALVMLMTPAGLALFYGGMSRYKNLLNTYAMTFAAYCLTSVVWVVWGYSLAFGTDHAGIIGGLGHILLGGIGVASVSGTAPHMIPQYVYVLFQMTFAAITLALVIGSVVDRLRFAAWIIFSLLWVTLVYCPVAHWVWGGGWLSKLGTLDFAGGTVVHINAGVAGLMLALVLGKRIGYGREAMFPSSVTLTALGAALLWFGWFGFNAGSELAADGLAGSAFLVTNSATSIAALTWMFIEWGLEKKPTLLGMASGAVAGLVAITPAAGFVNLGGSLVIGVGAAVFGFIFVSKLKHRFGYDDSLDAFGVHGICGMWGALATGLFADPAINPMGTGLLYGNPRQLWVQFVAIAATTVYTATATLIVIGLTRLVTGGLRIDPETEIVGLDSAFHGERGFEIQA